MFSCNFRLRMVPFPSRLRVFRDAGAARIVLKFNRKVDLT